MNPPEAQSASEFMGVLESEPERICPNGWKSPAEHTYTGGCYCVRKVGHAGRCRCDCGSTSTTAPPPGWVGSALETA